MVGRQGIEPILQPIDITVINKKINIITNEKTNRALRVFQPFSRYYSRIAGFKILEELQIVTDFAPRVIATYRFRASRSPAFRITT